ncbi:MAG: NAD(P)H-hydrate dehydratase [Thermotogota bacterium]|nr:NAD(P)H-hydrate dehydratase [Thermotogota bacterium]
MKIVFPDEMKSIDKETIEMGVPSLVLMESASIEVMNVIKEKFGGRVLILCGPGNNGGDGYALARRLKVSGYDVIAYSWKNPKTKNCIHNRDLFADIGGAIKKIDNFNDLIADIKNSEVVVDGIFGTGFKGTLPSKIIDVFNVINSHKCSRVAIDISSGINGNTGEVNQIAFLADVTVTFGLSKIGHYLQPGKYYTGELIVKNIGFPEKIINKFAKCECIDSKLAKELLPDRDPWGHKGSYGKVMIVGGNEVYTGAPLMAAQGAIISGCGKVITYTPEKVQKVIRNNVPQIIAYGSEKKNLVESDLPIMKDVDVLVIGPGIGRELESKNFVLDLLKMLSNLDLSKVLIDADALLAIKGDMKLLKNIDDTVITPHPGELSKLTGKGINELINNVELVREYASEWETTLILKGSTSIISDKDKDIRLNMTGNTGLAKGGSGDLLSGTIGAFMAQNMNGYDAASLGSYIMGKAAEMANVNQRSCTIHDVTGAYSKVFDLLKKINRC